jgi:uncharacterized protein (DUF488 family)
VVKNEQHGAGGLKTLYTIGHSNRSLDDFLDMLHGLGIRQLVDVRSQPSSRRFPLFNRSTLGQALEAEGIAYAWFGHELGGMRRGKSDSPHTALAADGFRGYADYMESAAFAEGMMRLTALAVRPTAIMCAERDPDRCHRSMIADYLVLRGWRVSHMLDGTTCRTHILNPLARSQDHLPVYDRLGQEQLDLEF